MVTYFAIAFALFFGAFILLCVYEKRCHQRNSIEGQVVTLSGIMLVFSMFWPIVIPSLFFILLLNATYRKVVYGRVGYLDDLKTIWNGEYL